MSGSKWDRREYVHHVWHYCAKFEDDLNYSEDKEDGQHPHFVGYFSSLTRAKAAVAHCRLLPGYRDWPDSFVISHGHMEGDAWDTGFFTYYYNKDDHE